MTESTTPQNEQDPADGLDENIPTPEHSDDNIDEDEWASRGTRGEIVGDVRPKE